MESQYQICHIQTLAYKNDKVLLKYCHRVDQKQTCSIGYTLKDIRLRHLNYIMCKHHHNTNIAGQIHLRIYNLKLS